MLIGNVGKDPEVHYYEADTAVAQVSLAEATRCKTARKCPTEQTGTRWCFGKAWPRQLKNTCIRAINCMLKAR